MKGSQDESCAGALLDQIKDDRAERERTRVRLMILGERVVEILRLDELPAGFDAPDKLGAIRNEAERLGLIRKEDARG